MYNASAKTKLFALVAILLLLLAPFGCMAGGPYTETFPRPFNSEKWKAAGHSANIRCGMLPDLEYRVGVVGKTRTELIELFGEEHVVEYRPGMSHWHLCPSFLDIWILEVEWKDGRAISAEVRDT